MLMNKIKQKVPPFSLASASRLQDAITEMNSIAKLSEEGQNDETTRNLSIGPQDMTMASLKQSPSSLQRSFLPRLDSFRAKNIPQADRYYKKNEEVQTPNESNQNKQFFQGLMSSRTSNSSLKISTDNYSGSILVFMDAEGQDRYRSKIGQSKTERQKEVDSKIFKLQHELNELYSSHNKQQLQQTQFGEQFEFLTQQLEDGMQPPTLSQFQGSNIPSKSKILNESDNSEGSRLPSITNNLLEHNNANTNTMNGDYSSKHNSYHTSSNSRSVGSLKQKVRKNQKLDVREQFAKAAHQYSAAITKAFVNREEDDPKKRALKKKKEPKFLIWNSVQKEGAPNNATEHMMRVYNKEHCISQVNVCLPSFSVKKDISELANDAYLQNYKPIAISKSLKVEKDPLPIYIKERIEQDILKFKEEQIAYTTDEFLTESRQQNSELNRAFLVSNQTFSDKTPTTTGQILNTIDSNHPILTQI